MSTKQNKKSKKDNSSEKEEVKDKEQLSDSKTTVTSNVQKNKEEHDDDKNYGYYDEDGNYCEYDVGYYDENGNYYYYDDKDVNYDEEDGYYDEEGNYYEYEQGYHDENGNYYYYDEEGGYYIEGDGYYDEEGNYHEYDEEEDDDEYEEEDEEDNEYEEEEEEEEGSDEYDDEGKEKKDVRKEDKKKESSNVIPDISLTDCPTFMKKRFCEKSSSCKYRHCYDALLKNRECRHWRDGKCTNVNCVFRHPELKKEKSEQKEVHDESKTNSNQAQPENKPEDIGKKKHVKETIPDEGLEREQQPADVEAIPDSINLSVTTNNTSWADQTEEDDALQSNAPDAVEQTSKEVVKAAQNEKSSVDKNKIPNESKNSSKNNKAYKKKEVSIESEPMQEVKGKHKEGGSKNIARQNSDRNNGLSSRSERGGANIGDPNAKVASKSDDRTHKNVGRYKAGNESQYKGPNSHSVKDPHLSVAEPQIVFQSASILLWTTKDDQLLFLVGKEKNTKMWSALGADRVGQEDARVTAARTFCELTNYKFVSKDGSQKPAYELVKKKISFDKSHSDGNHRLFLCNLPYVEKSALLSAEGNSSGNTTFIDFEWISYKQLLSDKEWKEGEVFSPEFVRRIKNAKEMIENNIAVKSS
jgi:hypothetical protein